MNPVESYARAIVAGDPPAGTYHRLACARHLVDLARVGAEDFPYVFDWPAAQRFIDFAQLLKHYKGQWAGQPIVLSPFQVFRLGCIFGWRRTRDGKRRFTTAYNELPRKSGKSLEAAIVAIYATFFEGEPGAEGYIVATKEKQAADVVFRDIKHLIQGSLGLKSRLKVQVKNVHRLETASKLEPLGSDSETLDGLNPHCIITDELHAFKTRDLLDVMESATGARANPLHFQITTAGDDLVSPCGDQHRYACRILDGVITDASTEAFFCCIAHADPDDEWQAEATWKKANPQYGISVDPDDLRKLALKAKNIPAAAAEFKQKRLNLWVNATAPCLSVDGWRTGQSSVARPAWLAELEHEPCFVGIDLASKLDLCVCSLVFPPTPGRGWRLIQHIWTPADTLADRAHRDRAPYLVWRDQGWLTETPGSQIDHQLIREVLRDAREHYDLERIGFDPWHADTLIDQLINEDGFVKEQVLSVPQTYAGMSSACLKVQAEIVAGAMDAGGCPVAAWAVSNVVGQQDGKGNLMFAKGRSRGRIDPVIALTIAVALWLKQPAEPKSVYLERGVKSLGDFL